MGIDVGTAIGAVIAAQDEGTIPPASLITRSGRGVWLFWFLKHDSGEGLVRAGREKVELWCAIQGAIGQQFAAVGSDADARDVARITRVAGSVNTKSMKAGRLLGSTNLRWEVPTYGLNELAHLFNVPLLEKKRRPPPAVDHVVTMYKLEPEGATPADGGKRWRTSAGCGSCAVGSRKVRGAKPVGCTLPSCGLAPHNGSPITILTPRSKLCGGKVASVQATWSNDSLKPPFAGSSPCKHRNQKLSDLLDVTPEESGRVGQLAARLPVQVDRRRRRGEADARRSGPTRRREYLRQLVDRLPIMPTLRDLEAALEEAGMKAAPQPSPPIWSPWGSRMHEPTPG